MKRFTGSKAAGMAAAAVVVLLVWHVLTLLYPPLIVPTMADVAGRLASIAASPEHWRTVGVTAARLLGGLALGVAAGLAGGMLLSRFAVLHAVFRPLVGLAQSIPPVSWLVLALIWFGFDGRASVFIVLAATMPVMLATVMEGLGAVEVKLLEMADLYGFSRWKRWRHVIWPSLLPYFRSGLHVALGIGCKTVVMGEVLTTASGVGGEITNARLNIEPEGIVAWTIVIVAFYYLLDALALRLLGAPGGGGGHAENTGSAEKLWGTSRSGSFKPRRG